MKIINTKLHGLFDYSTAFVLILPWVVNYYEKSNDTWIIASFGGLMLLYSLITDYEFGLIKLLPMKVHLILDVILGLILAASPWLFEISHYILFWPSLLGCVMIITVIFSSSSIPYHITRKDLDITKP